MGKDKTAQPRRRSIADQYLLFFNYEHYVAARAFMETRGYDLKQILELNHSEGTFSNWKNGVHPFDLGKIAAAMQQYDLLWSDVPFKDASSLKRKALAKTIEHFGTLDGGPGSFGGLDGLELMIGYVKALKQVRHQFLDRMISPLHRQEAVLNALRESCPSAARRGAPEVIAFVRRWDRVYADVVQALHLSFREYASDLDRITQR